MKEMQKLVCKEGGHKMAQHGKIKFINYCNNSLNKFYKAFVTRKG
jgi:hypothetical protein